MGDACWLNIRFARKYLDKVNEILDDVMWWGVFWDNEIGDEYEVDAEVQEANYGWHEYIYALAKAKISFVANHGPGGTYGPCTFACYKGDFMSCNADTMGYPVAKVHRHGVNSFQVARCKRLYQIEDMVDAEIEEDRKKGGINHEI